MPCQLLPEACSRSRSKPAQERYLWVTDRLDMTLAVDWSVKPQHNRAIFVLDKHDFNPWIPSH